MESSTNAVVSGIPPIITTINKSDERSLDTNPTAFEKSNELASNEKDESTADETLASYTDSSDDESSSSTQSSHHTNDSTRNLLKQAQQRLQHQSIYEEVKTLRAEVRQCKNSVESTLRQKLDIQNRYNTVESQLSQAMDTVQSYKLKESRWNDERAERERDFMNQLNDACSTMGAHEKTLMDEIIKRDMKIIELQNMWNEEEMRRMRSARERKKSDIVVHVETQARKGIHLEDNWSDDDSGEFI
mmetsp:Transcript_36606/g.65904  ORF Transcript_36606/g.65904 Transcript_36606/m.65904 type:complete len:245 (-) Transcript_36606:230-964(-)